MPPVWTAVGVCFFLFHWSGSHHDLLLQLYHTNCGNAMQTVLLPNERDYDTIRTKKTGLPLHGVQQGAAADRRGGPRFPTT